MDNTSIFAMQGTLCCIKHTHSMQICNKLYRSENCIEVTPFLRVSFFYCENKSLKGIVSRPGMELFFRNALTSQYTFIKMSSMLDP